MKLSLSHLVKKIWEYKFVIASLGIKTQAHEPPKLIKHFGTSEEIFTLHQVKLNAYKGFIVPIISYACQVWHPFKWDLVLIKIIQKSVTKWILGSSLTYKGTFNQTENSTSIFLLRNSQLITTL